jgi:hypothetical protein
MDSSLRQYTGLGSIEDISPKQSQSPNLLDVFKRQKLNLEERLKDTNEAITALEKNPEINRLLELIAKAR